MENENKDEVLDNNIKIAKDTGKFFISITYLDKDNNLQHSWVTEKFPKEDVVKSLKTIEQDFIEKEFSKKGGE